MGRADNNNPVYRLLRVLCACYCLAQGGRATTPNEVTTSVYENCGIMLPQESIQIKLITGRWYVIEVIQHKIFKHFNGEKIQVASCPYIYLGYTNEHTDTELKFTWEEDDGNIEYRFKINDKQSPGIWISSGAQNGTLTQAVYQQFAGTVIVRKAIQDHMVLTFCSPKTQLYSVVVAREKHLDPKELRSIMHLMNKQNLPITQRSLTCKNSSSAARAAIWLTVAAAVLCWFRPSGLAYKTD